MKYAKSTNGDIKITKISFGCSNFGGIGSDPKLVGKGNSEAEAHEILNIAYDFGINYYDTATTYAAGRSEYILGRWIKKYSIPREDIVISSKVNVISPFLFSFGRKGLSKKHITKQVDLSLERLGVDYLDLFYIHAPDPETPIIETLSALHDLVIMGKVRVLGASNVSTEYLKESLKISRENSLAEYKIIQNSYNYLQRNDEMKLIPFCKENGILYVAYGPLSGGILSGKYNKKGQHPKGSRLQLRSGLYTSLLNEDVFDRIDILKDIANNMGVSLPAMMYAWLYKNETANTFLVGPRNKTQFQSIVDAVNLKMSNDDFAMLNQLFG